MIALLVNVLSFNVKYIHTSKIYNLWKCCTKFWADLDTNLWNSKINRYWLSTNQIWEPLILWHILLPKKMFGSTVMTKVKSHDKNKKSWQNKKVMSKIKSPDFSIRQIDCHWNYVLSCLFFFVITFLIWQTDSWQMLYDYFFHIFL